MRTAAIRLSVTLAVSLLAFSVTGCGSNYKEQIVGKWKIVSWSGVNKEMEELKSFGVAMAYEFKSDGTFVVDAVPNDQKPESKENAEGANAGTKGKDFAGKYTMPAGDQVELTGAKDAVSAKNLRFSISITGDNMTWKHSDGSSIQLTRIK